MRLIPLLTALLVSVGLYGIVFERDALLAFALGNASADEGATQVSAQADPAAGDAAAGTVPAADLPQKPVIGVVVLRSQAQTVDSAVVVRGQTKANRQVEVRSETTATVISPPLRKGAYVQQGDLLCQLDPGIREATLAEARANLTQSRAGIPEAEARLDEANARLEEAEINNNAASKLSEGGFASGTRVAATQASVSSARASIASARTGLESAQAGIESAEASVAAAERAIKQLTITAPFEGLLESDTAELGSLMQTGTLCATVIQLDPIKLVGFVPETAVNRVTVGALAGAELATGQRMQGRVSFLSRAADPTTRTFEVEIQVPNPDLSIRDGQTADIAISSDGALAHKLPQSALTLNNEGQLGVRTVGAGDIVKFMPVQLLRDQIDGIWVSGLPETADVIVVGQDFVTEGVQVAPTYREAKQ